MYEKNSKPSVFYFSNYIHSCHASSQGKNSLVEIERLMNRLSNRIRGISARCIRCDFPLNFSLHKSVVVVIPVNNKTNTSNQLCVGCVRKSHGMFHRSDEQLDDFVSHVRIERHAVMEIMNGS